MKRIGAFTLYLFVTLYLALFFAPKINLYYKAEELLSSMQVVVS